jgi:hypothetical protein
MHMSHTVHEFDGNMKIEDVKKYIEIRELP